MKRNRFIFISVSLLAIVILASSFTDFVDVSSAISDPATVSTTTTPTAEGTTTTTTAEETTTTTGETTADTTTATAPKSTTKKPTTTTTTTQKPTTTTTTAYVPNTVKKAELTEQQREEILADFAHYLWYDEEWYEYGSIEKTKKFCSLREYYGTYNSYMALAMDTGFGPAMPTEYDVAEGYYFTIDGGCDYYLYRDGEFIWLSSAYKSGLITIEDLKDIWHYAHGGKHPVQGPVHGGIINNG